MKTRKQLQNQFSAVSLFSGAGGMDMGFENEGINTIWANDIDKDSCITHASWSKAEIVNKKIENVDFNSVPDSDVILGGFPCQGFSLAGPRKIDDSRNKLYRKFVELVALKKPKVFVAENVKGLLTLGGGEIMKAIISDFESNGYNVKFRLFNAADYSVPQDRYRVFIVGTRIDLSDKFNFPQSDAVKITLRNSLSHLDDPDESDVNQAPFSSRYISRNRKRNWDDVSYTIPAMAKQVAIHPSSPDMKKIHRDLWEFGNPNKTRRFSWREVALIQTFPENLEFHGNLDSKYRQIGNAVPVNLAQKMAKNISSFLIKI